MEKPQLTQDDWKQIRYAAEEKHGALKAGLYGNDRTAKEWVGHMEFIIEGISPTGEADADDFDRKDWEEIYSLIDGDEVLSEKLGPDGSNMYEED